MKKGLFISLHIESGLATRLTYRSSLEMHVAKGYVVSVSDRLRKS